jgi:DNA-binding response OmpR family regulator
MAATDKRTDARILLVEDDELLACAVEARLRIEGMSPTSCATSEALVALSSAYFDAIVLDVTGDGIEQDDVLGRIRARAAMNHLPVVLLMPKQDAVDGRDRRLPVAACQTVMKPFTGQELVRKVRLSLVERRTGEGTPATIDDREAMHSDTPSRTPR